VTGRRRGRRQSRTERPHRNQPQIGRRHRGGRADQAIALIEVTGVTAGEVAKTLKVKPNYLYRVLGDLDKAGRVKKGDCRYRPAR